LAITHGTNPNEKNEKSEIVDSSSNRDIDALKAQTIRARELRLLSSHFQRSDFSTHLLPGPAAQAVIVRAFSASMFHFKLEFASDKWK
jgi:hypothetical protein